jgi:hypothetical protein
MKFSDFNFDDSSLGESYLESLDLLRQSLDEIPFGWHRIFEKTLRSLSAVDCPERASVRVMKPRTQLGVLSIEMNQRDRVVDGIIGRLIRKSRCTCQRCGRHGKMRSLGMDIKTLCVRCYVPYELNLDLDLWIEQMKREDHFRRRHTLLRLSRFKPSLLALIPRDRWKTIDGDNGACIIEYITPEDMLELRPELNEVYFHVRQWVARDGEDSYR